MDLSQNELIRYGRQMILPEVGKSGQLKLKAAKVLLVGAGGLGCPQAIYLAAAGVGTIGIIDPDKVELSNLHRQVLHQTSDLGKPKVESARDKLKDINPEIQIKTYHDRLNAQNAMSIIADYDLVIDGTDNFPARYLINDACILSGKPFVYAGVLRFEGQVSVFGFPDGPCYRCFFSEPPAVGEIPSCAEAGVVGVLPGIIGLLQSNEAIKLICRIGEPLAGRLLIFDALATRFREIKIKKDPACPICSSKRTIQSLNEYGQSCQAKEGQRIKEITVHELRNKISGSSLPYILDVREQNEWDIVHLKGAVLKPLSELENIFGDIPRNKNVYVYCQKGGRGTRAIEFLQSKGFLNCINIKGGLDAWIEEIDPSLSKY
ncbi:MAG TPA: molybdopterin-synthase adenylyltransferase MoeB [Candidatus Omnitrophota bacterium]|nr:molybdopterin-synthase adenylyltransferase MoeB [Candidatus Omnitrophota bacterium]